MVLLHRCAGGGCVPAFERIWPLGINRIMQGVAFPRKQGQRGVKHCGAKAVAVYGGGICVPVCQQAVGAIGQGAPKGEGAPNAG